MAQEYKLSKTVTLVWTGSGFGSSDLRPAEVQANGFPLLICLLTDQNARTATAAWSAKESLNVSQGWIKVHIRGSFVVQAHLQPGHMQKGDGAEVKGVWTNVAGTYGSLTAAVEATLTARASSDACVQLADERQAAAGLANSSMSEQVPNDVALAFPRNQRVLWSSEAFLVAKSALFETLLQSGFQETVMRNNLNGVFQLPEPTTVDPPFDDSDGETDVSKLVKRGKTRGNTLAPFKVIQVTDSCFVTYAAVLAWLSSRHISFAPLLSNFADETNTTPNEARTARLKDLVKQHPQLPIPASPKSVYRLAHYLGLEQLATLALENFESQLTPKNAAYELSSRLACCYPQLRDVVLAYVVLNWDKVVESSAWEEVEKDADEGKLPAEFGKTAMLLAKALKAKK